MSSYQPTDLTALIREHRIEHVVVRLYLTLERPPQRHSRYQIESARANGCSIGGYVWQYEGVGGGTTVRGALELADACNLALPVLWLDCEEYDGLPGPGFDRIWEAAQECHSRGQPVGMYSRYGWLMAHLTTDERRLLAVNGVVLWLADYDGIPTLDCAIPEEWNYAALWGKQFISEPVDLDVFKREAVG